VGDPVVPLCSVGQFTEGALGDLVSAYPANALEDALAQATRMAEEIAGWRLAPFTLTETVRVAELRPDEFSGRPRPPFAPPPPPPADPVAFGLIRHFWLKERPPRYQDMWAWDLGAIVTSGPDSYSITTIIDGPDDQGHVWVQPAYWLAPGSRCRVTYGGGFTPIVPASLVRVGMYMTAAVILQDLNPDDDPRSADAMYASAEKILTDGGWVRGKGGD
jgi:hypothetical protein